MDEDRARDEFHRIELRQEQERDRAMIRQYEGGLAFRRLHLEQITYTLGRLDGRLGGWRPVTTVEEHGAALFALARHEHEEFLAKVRGWLEQAEAEGRTADIAWNRDLIDRLEAIPKPWEAQRAA